MVKHLDIKDAREVWDSMILSLDNPLFYQSFTYAMNYDEDINNIHFLYTEKGDRTHIAGFALETEDSVKMPFGPIIAEGTTIDEIMDFIKEISNQFGKNVVFSLNEELRSQVDDEDISDVWTFVTPLVDTSKGMDEVLKNCNTNRRRIFRKVLKAYSEECIKEGEEYLPEFYDLYQRRLQETDGELDVSLEFLEGILKYKDARLVVCEYKNKVIAGAVVYDYADTLTTRYNCFDSNYSDYSPIARVDYHMLEEATSRPEINYYDMSGLCAPDEVSQKLLNINRYKESFGPTKNSIYNWVKYKKRVKQPETKKEENV